MPVVRGSWLEGRTQEAKAAMAAEITESIVRHTGAAADYSDVIFDDVVRSNWAGAGSLHGEPMSG